MKKVKGNAHRKRRRKSAHANAKRKAKHADRDTIALLRDGELTAALEVGGRSFDARFETADGKSASAEAVVDAWRRDMPLVPLLGGGFAPLPGDWLTRHGHLLAKGARVDRATARGTLRSDREKPEQGGVCHLRRSAPQ